MRPRRHCAGFVDNRPDRVSFYLRGTRAWCIVLPMNSADTKAALLANVSAMLVGVRRLAYCAFQAGWLQGLLDNLDTATREELTFCIKAIRSAQKHSAADTMREGHAEIYDKVAGLYERALALVA
jgi:hypothetical protein